MITYSTNWMGPVSMDWFRERGLVDSTGNVTLYYSAGRIDIRDDTKHGYDGWDEYSLAPMHGEDWNALSDWLDTLHTEELWPYDKLISEFEDYYGMPISWDTYDRGVEA